ISRIRGAIAEDDQCPDSSRRAVEDARTIGFTFASDAPLAIALATVRSRWRDLVGTAGATGIGPRRLRSTPAAGTAPLRLEEQPAVTGDVAAPSDGAVDRGGRRIVATRPQRSSVRTVAWALAPVRQAVARGVGDASQWAAEESTTPDLVELSRRSVGRESRRCCRARAQARGGEER